VKKTFRLSLLPFSVLAIFLSANILSSCENKNQSIDFDKYDIDSNDSPVSGNYEYKPIIKNAYDNLNSRKVIENKEKPYGKITSDGKNEVISTPTGVEVSTANYNIDSIVKILTKKNILNSIYLTANNSIENIAEKVIPTFEEVEEAQQNLDSDVSYELNISNILSNFKYSNGLLDFQYNFSLNFTISLGQFFYKISISQTLKTLKPASLIDLVPLNTASIVSDNDNHRPVLIFGAKPTENQLTT
jgi:hypothetical protein